MGQEFKPFTNLPYIDPAEPNPQGGYASELNQPGGFGFYSALQVGAGAKALKVDSDGMWLGADRFADAPFSVDMQGNVITNSIVINGLSGAVLASSIDANGNFINYVISDSINTQSKLILGEFQFSGSGALAIKTDDSNGIWLSPTGILAKNAGTTKFALDINGNATFAGNLVAASGTLGSITAGTITGATVQSAASGYRVKLSSAGLQFLNSSTVNGSIGTDAYGSMVYYSLDNHYFRDGSTELARIQGAGIQIPNASAFVIASGARMRYTGGYLYFDGASGGAIGTKFEGSVLPNSDNTRDLGAPSYRWRSIYAEDIYPDDVYIGDRIFSSDGSQGQDYASHKVITDIWQDGSELWCSERYYTIKDGLVVDRTSESDRRVN